VDCYAIVGGRKPLEVGASGRTLWSDRVWNRQTVKIVAILLILSALTAAGFKAYGMAQQSGRDAAELEFALSLDAIKTKAAEDAVRDWKAAQVIAGETTDAEIRIVEKIRVVEREIPKIIERIVEVKPECSDLPELGVLFSQQAEISNSRADRNTEDPG